MDRKYFYFIKALILLQLIHRTIAEPSFACPDDFTECSCDNFNGLLTIDCSGKDLTKLPDFMGAQLSLHSLDLSNNQIREFPQNLDQFPHLTILDLSRNQISEIPENSLADCINLRFLYLNENNISNWININPNTVLRPAINLETLSLAANPITSFSTADESFLLTSSSLTLLDLSDCKITKITGQYILQGLSKLEHLLLNGNPLRSVTNLISDSLKSLDLSNCKLTYLQPNIFLQLTSLIFVNLSKNHRLSLVRKENEVVVSESLRRIDLSLCNMDYIELHGMPNLMTAILRGNLISQVKKESFEKNLELENIDLSYNSISFISSLSFRHLKLLKNLDLSYNMIRRIERDTFKSNDILTSINLSRNYIERFNRISAKSLTHLNVSWCEILKIDLDAFNDLPELVELDLSNNLFTEFPISLQSQTLQTLNLNTCRLSTNRFETFQGFPELAKLNLAGNRFTTTFETSFFEDNPYLVDIWLADNPWRCECADATFLKFYNYLIEQPSRINDRNHLRCTSPADLYSFSWELACFDEWHQTERTMGTAQKAWTIIMVTIVVLSGVACVAMSIRRCLEGRKLTRREEERLRNLEESRDIMRQNRMMLEQENQLNAPDPRESRPPCYADAILLPRIDGSFASLDELSTKRCNRKSKHHRSSNKEGEEEVHMVNRNRFRSEEVLSVRERLSRPIVQNGSNISTVATNRPEEQPAIQSIQPEELHYHSTSLSRLNHAGLPPLTRSNDSSSVEILTLDKSQSFTNIEASPYAQRKSTRKSPYARRRKSKSSQPNVIPNTSTEQSNTTANPSDHISSTQSASDPIVIVDDYYRQSCSSSSNSSNEDFSTFSNDEMKNVK